MRALRTADELPLSIEAEERGQAVSHIALSPVKITYGFVMLPRRQLALDHGQQSTQCDHSVYGRQQLLCAIGRSTSIVSWPVMCSFRSSEWELEHGLSDRASGWSSRSPQLTQAASNSVSSDVGCLRS